MGCTSLAQKCAKKREQVTPAKFNENSNNDAREGCTSNSDTCSDSSTVSQTRGRTHPYSSLLIRTLHTANEHGRAGFGLRGSRFLIAFVAASIAFLCRFGALWQATNVPVRSDPDSYCHRCSTTTPQPCPSSRTIASFFGSYAHSPERHCSCTARARVSSAPPMKSATSSKPPSQTESPSSAPSHFRIPTLCPGSSGAFSSATESVTSQWGRLPMWRNSTRSPSVPAGPKKRTRGSSCWSRTERPGSIASISHTAISCRTTS
ncbi:hypothetical protein C8J57DRAFT_1311182 [Mycena rebaudengoi]|nr:hypothetical protein C8J57DRAFT_1311182 [Mycena rebaudengoi]